MGRAPCCDKASVKKGPWSPEEDAKLKAYIEQHGTGGNWIALPQKIGLKRCGKSCRLRWLNYLRPNIKHGGFSEEEDNIICSLYISIGSRWSIIAAQLPGRTDNDIKNYWNTRLKKKLLGRSKPSHIRRVSALNDESKEAEAPSQNPASSGLSASALERMQLHLQLHTFQNPLSFYSTPALWPKLQALAERNEPSDFSALMAGCAASQQQKPIAAEVKQEEFQRSLLNGLDSNHPPVMPLQMMGGLESEFNDLICNKTSGFMEHEDDHMHEFWPMKEIPFPQDSSLWWANDFDAQSSSNSWDSGSAFHQEGMLQEYLAGYGL